jgi:hypothetical protein
MGEEDPVILPCLLACHTPFIRLVLVAIPGEEIQDIGEYRHW